MYKEEVLLGLAHTADTYLLHSDPIWDEAFTMITEAGRCH